MDVWLILKGLTIVLIATVFYVGSMISKDSEREKSLV